MEFVRFKQQLNYYNKSKFCTFYNFSHILKQMFYPENEEPYCLNLTQKYIQHWCFLHGLRQLYQNWMDAIRQKNLGKIIKIRKTIQGNLIKFQVNNMWQLYRLQSILHANILNNRLALRQQRPQLEKDLNLHEQKMYQSLKVNGFCSYYLHQYVSKQGIDKIYPFFLEQFKTKELYPIYSHDHQAQINKYFLIYGLKADFYPTQSTSYHLYHSLIKSSFFKTIKNKVETQILGKIQSDLNDNQKQKMKQIQKKISVLLPQINNYIFKLKDLPKVVCYKSDQLKTIFLNIHEINNEQKVKRQLLRLMLIE